MLIQTKFRKRFGRLMNLKELSQRVGLSQTTVSRALNGYPEVSEATRLRVQAAATEFNYSPNIRAKSLATGRALAIGHVIPMSTKHEMVNPVFGDFIAGAGETYSRNGYDMILSIVPDDEEESVYRSFRAKGNVDGLIVHGPRMVDSRIDLLTEIQIPFVVHGRASDQSLPYSWLDVNNTSAFQRATNFLLDLGHKKIALINGLESMDFAHRRRLGFENALKENGLTPNPDLMRSEEMTENYGYQSATEMLRREEAPTAFLAASLIIALGIRRAIDDAGLVMGKDVSVITFDDMLSYLSNGDSIPIFTATRSSVREAGAGSAQMLIDLINSPSKQPQTKLLEAELTIGSSTGPAPH
jgi:LacI family transcriptional regulator